MTAGVLEAVAASAAYGVATVAQAAGARRIAAETRRGFLLKARVGWLYGAGLVLDALGFVATVGALHTLPLFFVESAVAASVGVTAGVMVALTGIRLTRVESTAVGTMLFGLVLLAASAQPGQASSIQADARWWLLGAAVALVALTWAGVRSVGVGAGSVGSAVSLAATGGFGFALVGIAARVLDVRHPLWRTLESPVFWALAIAGIVGTIAFGTALAHAPVTAVAAITFAVETTVPSIFGLMFLGDAVRPHMGAIALVGFAATLTGCISLARMADGEAHASQQHHAHA